MATDYIVMFLHPGKELCQKMSWEIATGPENNKRRDNSHIALMGSNPIFLFLPAGAIIESDICHGLFRENVYFSQLTTLFDLTEN